jgi:hypothetical protein
MKNAFEWLVRHEKFVIAVTAVLLLALGLQTYFKRKNRMLEICSQEANPSPASATSPPSATSAASTPRIENASDPFSITGKWEMLVQKRKGTTSWTLILEQQREVLSGIIKSEGGDLPVTGTIKRRAITFTAQRFGFTVEFLASFDGNVMAGQMHALTVDRKWTAKRLPESAQY